ncbi:MAG: hypothetical protein COU63_05075 [Candidatus Pacebacteria bacterium CG10_big_fil_rev_8_21_14_0_10_36_11]|nr:MAG: hypothetical protein AUK08_04785 [Candidatus Pacebacteria bacterium CG2_30_36_39]PIR64310.1 MAG: hypothetical protein COU63_05075 [Candidatus Pacebacteria bacterium CG10_big_fil_rev_8_21_14_0_10_36_11]PJC43162.1 MAG: hypothetical protein CO040_00625 [Candidatus Pacebacteria bacterium CG_4_9_14_0_2_um_filter_36_8]
MINIIDSANITNNSQEGSKDNPPQIKLPDATGVASAQFQKKFSEKPQRKGLSKYLIAGILLLLLAIGGGASLYLMSINQDLRQQADQGDYTNPTDPPEEPTTAPTTAPTTEPTGEPTTEPTTEPTGEPTTEPTGEPTDGPTGEPTTEPTGEPTTEPTTDPGNGGGGSSSSSSSSSSSTAVVNINNGSTTIRVQPTLPPQLPQTGPEDWLKYLQVGLGALGVGALFLLFL